MGLAQVSKFEWEVCVLTFNFFYLIYRRPWDALEDPFKFRVDTLNATLTIGFTKTDFFDKVDFGYYWLKVEETLFEELPTYDEMANAPKIAHSTVEEFFGNNI